MSKQLVEDIMALEEQTEKQLAQASKEHDTTIQRAHEKALLTLQEAENMLDTEREQTIKQHTKQLEEEKRKAIEAARTEAKALGNQVSKRVPKAAEHLRKAFMESATNVS